MNGYDYYTSYCSDVHQLSYRRRGPTLQDTALSIYPSMYTSKYLYLCIDISTINDSYPSYVHHLFGPRQAKVLRAYRWASSECTA